MNQQIQPGAHLDADQISVFVEGVATAREREEVLIHLARCPECRDAVFLLQSSAGPAPALIQAPRRRWLMPFGLAGAALAAAITLLVFLRPHPAARVERQQQAAVKQPAPAAAPAAHPQPLAPPKTAPPPNLPTASTATGAAIGQPRSPQKTSALADSASSPRPAAPATAPIVVAEAPPAPAVEKPQPPNAGAVADRNLPISGRSMATLARPVNPPALIIEHGRGPESGTSQISGRVTDTIGAVIPGADVTLRDATGTTRQATTANDGSFDISAVPPGHYELFITARGFETSKQAVDLEARDLAMLNSSLRVGASTETVTVTAASAPTLSTDSAEVGTIMASLPSRLPASNTVSNGRRTLSLDSAGTLFLSHNGGKSWKRIKPSWSGKIVDVSLAAAPGPEADASAKKSKSAGASAKPALFEITTDAGAHWTSPDGTHWFVR